MGIIVKSLLVVFSVFLVSCNTGNQSDLTDKLNDISDNQKVLLKKKLLYDSMKICIVLQG